MIVAQRTTRRARTLIELIMKEMHASLRDPDRLSPEQWDKLFGAKQSMIANLQKLVATLKALPDMEEAGGQRDAPITVPEIQMLTSWLAEQRKD